MHCRARAAVTGVLFVALAALASLGGCHSSESNDGCYSDGDCAVGEQCDTHYGTCIAPTDGGSNSCSAPDDCPPSYTCGEKSRCLPGDCYFNGCVTGFECQSSTGRWECLPSSGDAAGAAGS